jgi:two-component system cell cycle sensor histidine kinase/response regulator CckA
LRSSLAGNEMKAEDKAKEQLIDELLGLRQRIAELETSEEDRKRAEEALRKSEERYRRITAAVTDYIFTVHTKNGHPVETVHGPACVAVTGYTPEEYASDPYLWFCMVHEEDRSAVQGQATRVLLGQDTQPIEHRIWRKDGVLRWVRSTLVPHYDIQGKLISYDGLISDITERRQAEEEKEKLEAQLQRAQKMEAVGTLAGGVAHDFNNLLMSIQGNISLMLLAMDPTHPHYERLKRTEERVQSGARLAKQLLGYARKGRYEVKPTSLNQLVEETAETFGITRKGITIHKEFAEGLFDIEVDRGQMEQVLLNLFINAADAMPKGGNLILKTRDTTHEGIKDIVYDAKPGNYVLLTVTDTGIGMDNETQERIFDPFFTTKERGRGTGLGLASVYGIIKAHGGYINVESGKEHGTTFSIYLPASEKKAQRTVKTVERCIKGTATVLMIDDEDALREVGQELLTVMGYRVLVARDGKEAIEVYRKNWHTIDLVLLDMIMPNMGGGEAYDCMREINPDIKVLLSSGYSVDGEASEILKRGCRGFIQKPFKMSELSRKIEEILQM